MTIGTDLRAHMGERINFMLDVFTLREIRGWPNNPVYNAAIIYELYGWSFDEKDAEMIREEARTRTASSREA